LISYTRYHFTAEERLMQKYNYPEFREHQAEHVKLAGQVEHFINDYAEGETQIDDKVMEFLKHWLVDHILNTDVAFGLFLSKAGLS
jgi:hemerythrin